MIVIVKDVPGGILYFVGIYKLYSQFSTPNNILPKSSLALSL